MKLTPFWAQARTWPFLQIKKIKNQNFRDFRLWQHRKSPKPCVERPFWTIPPGIWPSGPEIVNFHFLVCKNRLNL